MLSSTDLRKSFNRTSVSTAGSFCTPQVPEKERKSGEDWNEGDLHAWLASKRKKTRGGGGLSIPESLGKNASKDLLIHVECRGKSRTPAIVLRRNETSPKASNTEIPPL